MDRREFIKCGLAAGGILATSKLPTFGGDNPALFATRGRFEQLVLAYQHVHIGLKEPFSVLHISDTHLTEAYAQESGKVRAFAEVRRQTFGGKQEQALRDSLAWARKNTDYVVHTGDLLDFFSEANLDLARKYYGAGGVLGSTGNHEYQMRAKDEAIRNTAEYNAQSRAALDRAFTFDTLFQSTVVRGVNFVTLDNSYGFVTAEQAARFADEAKKGLPIVLCMHVPILTEHIWRSQEKFWRGSGKPFRSAAVTPPYGDLKRQNEDATTQQFIARLKKEPLLKAILAGHLHITVQERFSETAVQYVVGGNYLFHGEEILFT